MIAENGMSAVNVKKDELLTTLKKNREIHLREYKAAHEGYKKAFVKELTSMLARAKKGKFIHHVALQEPANYTSSYDKVIKMLTMSVNDTILITDSEFSQYVLDEWNWKAHSTAVNMAYVKGRR
jgi:TFIIF-interacting CTD phosphatase-like protein